MLPPGGAGGALYLGTDAVIRDSGGADPVALDAIQHQVQDLPAGKITLSLLGSRYCETDRLLSDDTWPALFGKAPLGWPRVQAICITAIVI